jgi:copper chaperone CopZ
MHTPHTTLPLTGASERTSGCGCGCGHHGDDTIGRKTKEDAMTATQTFPVTGMTCDHCVHAVTTEVGSIPGVSAVTVNLVAGGTSTLTLAADEPVDPAAVAAALDEAGGYHLATT